MSADEGYMRQALRLAQAAGDRGEVPVGAVLVDGDRVIGEGSNSQIEQCDPTAHAEVLALRAGALACQNYRLPNTTLYVTLEPCTMCCGAMVHARIGRLVFAAREPKAGAVISTAMCLDSPSLNHRVLWEEGLLAADSATMLREFFRARRREAGAANRS